MQPVNSRPYWDGRFDAEWEALRGRDQSRFFASLAVAMWPAWLSQRQCAQAWTLCDWGCAMGDGTDELAQALGLPCTGVDFSDVAVRKAAQSYPGSRFVADDWLQPGGGGDPHRWDIVFSSNTLEHFDDPWQVFAALSRRAGRFIVLLLPFEEPEHGRSPEHRYRFDRDTLQLCPTPEWVLCDATVSDLGPSPFWPGQQVLLTYGRCSELSAMGFVDADSRLSRIVAPDAQAIERQRAPDLAEALRQRDLASAKLGELLQAHHRLLAETVQAPARASGWRRWLGL
ncbi:MAG: class I SAM-dependent methyltransferase [Rubrivivax sp.]|jgi:SAM-dependent methyltransferase|nr:class I SAM-dependent methyltransferase [Rubrivivax sp.]